MDQEKPLRERLIDVGVDLVLTEGTAAVGLREIARRAGVSHGAPRRYFPTHHALLSAIARRGFEDLAARVGAAIAGTAAPRARLRAIAGVYVGHALERRGMFELMFRHDLLDSTGREDTGQPQLRASTLPLFELLVSLVSRCGVTTDAEVTAAALWANLHGVAQLWAFGSLPLVLGTDGEEYVGRLVDAALDAHLGAAAS
ncbi:TetR/AcrR family transcriptional regulator [Streptomyces sp. BR123]|uniref:TetR/AcrR family transcriptional regulator n=1 Tax=Streptomyces sp. BR123 TaxID=2749828 RepID=UPI0015C44AA2|nr:TetR/AcrR family transcriptional regulator [Streptomyces sp. BR123]NXY96824.1 TetR/AcrR family transcriptional regulator [Streptomyces sp. BR123]